MLNSNLPRLPARKTPLLEALIYRVLVRPALRRSFDRVMIGGAEPPPSALPTLIYSNHPSWWDGYIAFFLSDERWRRRAYLMMEEPQLRRYGFFRYCGVFGVDRHDAREGMRAVHYAADLLRQRPNRVLWIFPQGEITPNDRRPLGLFRGSAHVAKLAAPVRCVPMALRFEFGAEQRPEVLIRFGAAHVVEPGVQTRMLHTEMEQRLTAEVDRLRNDVIDGSMATYETALRGRDSVNVRWDKVRAWVRGKQR